MEKQRLLYQQSRLHNRGAAEMVLQMISACKGAVPAPKPQAHTHPTVSTLPLVHPLLTPHASDVHIHSGSCRFSVTSAYRSPSHTHSQSARTLHLLHLLPSCPCGGRVFLWLFCFGGWHPQAETLLICLFCLVPGTPRRDGGHGVFHTEAGYLHPQRR